MHQKEQHSETNHSRHRKCDSDELSTLVKLEKKKGLPPATAWYSVRERDLRRAANGLSYLLAKLLRAKLLWTAELNPEGKEVSQLQVAQSVDGISSSVISCAPPPCACWQNRHQAAPTS